MESTKSQAMGMANPIQGPLDEPGLASVDAVVAEAMRRWKQCSEWEATARDRFLDDVKFAEGDSDNGFQWPAAIKRNRDVDKRPCLTMNIIRQHNLQIRNEAKQNKASIKVRATGGGASFKSANLIEALIRQIEYRSNAQDAYSHAGKYQVDGGIGWIRLITQFVAEDSFDQELIVKKVWDPLSVYIDPDAHEEDKSDANFAFVFDLVAKDKFYDAYPEFDGVASLQPLGIGTSDSDFLGKDYVRVCEYFRRRKIKDKLVSFVNPNTQLRQNLLKSKMPPGLYQELKERRKGNLLKERETERVVVEWFLIVGQEVLDETEWAGKYIPLIPVIGEESVVDGTMDRKGHTRAMKDAQRMYNYNAPLALSTPIPTPNGWTTIGEIGVGDEVLSERGLPVQVLGTSPVFTDRICYEIKFSNGSKIVADAGHKWNVEERGKRKTATWDWKNKTVTTADLEVGKHFIHSPAPLQLEEDKELPIHPYLLGVWLGDGHTAATRISSHMDDIEEMRAHIASLGYSVGEARQDGNSNGGCFSVLGVRDKFAKVGFLGDKWIPIQYLRASEAQRWALLQGLMDTDGHVTPKQQCVFVNTNSEIVTGFVELLRTFGINLSIQRIHGTKKLFPNGKEYNSHDNFRVSFTADPTDRVFRLSRKQAVQQKTRQVHWRRTKRIGIESITAVSSVPVKCIGVDSESHLFLAGWGMVPTHNSAQIEFVALQSKTPYIASNKAIEEYETMWNTANVVNHSVLIYNAYDPDNPDKPLQPPIRQEPPRESTGFASGMQTAFNQMMMTSGQWQNQMGMQGNERTGSAIKARQGQADTSVYHFQDNYASALRSVGKKIIDIYSKIYDTKRLMRLAMEDGEEFDLELDPKAGKALQEFQNEAGQTVMRVLNPAIGTYDVEADVGASYGTRRQETVEALTLVLTQAPGLTGIIGDLLMRAMDFKESREAAMRLRRMVPAQALGEGPSQAEQQLQQRLAASQAALSKALQEAAKKDLKLIGKDEMRDIDVYDARTKRISALADLLPEDPKVLQDLLQQLDEGTIGETLRPILEANIKQLKEQAGGEAGAGSAESAGGGAGADSARGAAPGSPAPPYPGARQAPDGEWYILDPTRRGKYLRIAPLAQKRQVRGVA